MAFSAHTFLGVAGKVHALSGLWNLDRSNARIASTISSWYAVCTNRSDPCCETTASWSKLCVCRTHWLAIAK